MLGGYEILAEVGAKGLFAAELGRTLVNQGRLAEAAEYIGVAEEASGGDLAPQIIWRSTKARIAAQDGAGEDPVALALEAVELAEMTDASTMIADAQLALAEVLGAVGGEADAHAAAERAADSYERKGHIVGVRAAEVLLTSHVSRRP